MISLGELSDVRQKHADKKVVLTSGTFDLLHVGHLHYLQAVKAYGDVVVVLLSSDDRVKERKGPSRPIIPQADRAELLEGLKVVDYVLLDPDSDELRSEIVNELQPDLYVTDGPDPRFLSFLGESARVILPRESAGEHMSTSAIINHIAKTVTS